MMNESISCPVSHVTINNNRVRITAALVFLGVLSYIPAPHLSVAIFLVIDFFLRGFGWNKYSPLNIASGWLVKIFSVKYKPYDQAPKKFAAQLGFVMAVLLLVAHLLSLPTAALAVSFVFLLFSFLESALGICAGCYVYTFVRQIFPDNRVG